MHICPSLTNVCKPRAQEEMAHTCRGTVNLSGAFIDNIDSTNFVITNGPQVKPLEYNYNEIH